MRITVIILTLLTGAFVVAEDRNLPTLTLNSISKEPFLIHWNTKRDIQVGTNLLGFVVTKVTPKTGKMNILNKEITVDRTEATLQRGSRIFTLVRGEELPFNDYFVNLTSGNQDKSFKVRLDDTFVVDNRTFRLVSVNTQNVTCVVVDIKSKQEITIQKKQ
ncbi:MAG: hypothetical protein PHR77_20420 [Kiritimatiellae bacterium]|nr:hypothetical protein [Kiritimatiellia bacterium]MDD5521198.1 hypothetical protein [Kiritimatiellia bacterium]